MRHLPHTRFFRFVIYQRLGNFDIQIMNHAPLFLERGFLRFCLFQFFHTLGQFGDVFLLLRIHAHQLLGGVGQAFDGDGKVVLFRVDVVDLHQHQLGDVFGVADDLRWTFVVIYFGLR